MSFWIRIWRTFSSKKKVDSEDTPGTPTMKTNSNGVSFEAPIPSSLRAVSPVEVTSKPTFWTPPEHNKHYNFIPKNYFEINRPCTIQTQRCPGANYHFEVQILDSLPAAHIFIGLAPLKMDTHLIPGLYEKSIALEVKSRKFYRGGNLIDVSPFKKIQPNDIISVSMRYILSDNLYYEIQYKNQYNETIPLQIISKCFLAPVIHATAACRLQVNFGETPFKNLHDRHHSSLNLTKSLSSYPTPNRQITHPHPHPRRQKTLDSPRQSKYPHPQPTFDSHQQSTFDPRQHNAFDSHQSNALIPHRPDTFDFPRHNNLESQRQYSLDSQRQSSSQIHRQNGKSAKKRTT